MPGLSGKLGEPGRTDRTYIHFSDNDLCAKLEKQVTDRNIRIMNRVMLTELMKDSNGRVVGESALAEENPNCLFSKRRVSSSTKGWWRRTDCPPPCLIGYSMAQPGTGDGVMMAYRAGADVQNAEFGHPYTSLRMGPGREGAHGLALRRIPKVNP